MNIMRLIYHEISKSKKFLGFVILLLVILNLNCKNSNYGYPPDTYNQVTIEQGIWGNVWFWEGDFQPVGFGKITPVVRTVYVYELTPLDSGVIGSRPFYSQILTQLIASTQSNSTGFYQVTLPEGEYSIFVKEDSLYYANPSDGQFINPVEVVRDSVSKVQIDIIYKAYF